MKIIWDLVLEYVLIFQKTIEKYTMKNPPEEWRTGDKGDVILVPGFEETWVAFRTLSNFLNSKGYKIHRIPFLEPNTYPIQSGVSKVEEYINKQGLKKVILLAHSKGGIVAQILLTNPTINKKIQLVFNLAVPNQGTLWGWAYFMNLKELLPYSQIIKSLPKFNPKVINIYPKVDNHVIPNKSLILQGAQQNICIDIVGHTRILESEKTCKAIEQHLPS